jgi:uncharacterized YigZ family protein
MGENSYKAVYQGGSGEIEEKKSRFIATIRPVESEEEAVSFIAEMKKQYWDARHNCSAFIIGRNQELTRCSDDGEPSGTAGRPMLDVLLKEGIHNAAVVVTRYFGGTLLGTGGLVRAYQRSVQEGLKNCVVIEKNQGRILEIGTDYNGMGKIQYLLGNEKIAVLDTVYSDEVKMTVIVPEEKKAYIEKSIIDATGAKAELVWKQKAEFAKVGKEIKIFSKTS